MSCSTGTIPREVRSLISCARFSSQFLMYGLLRTRRGRPCIIIMFRAVSKLYALKGKKTGRENVGGKERAHSDVQ